MMEKVFSRMLLTSFRWTVVVLLVFIQLGAMGQLVEVGSGLGGTTDQKITPFATFFEDMRHQYLYRGSELTVNGGGAGFIGSIGFEVTIPISQVIPQYTIQVKTVTDTVLTTSTFDPSGFTQVYQDTVLLDSADWYDFQLDSPFFWDGTSSILIEVCFDNNTFTANSGVRFTPTGFDCNRYAYNDNTNGCSMAAFNVNGDRPNARFGIIPAAPTAVVGDSLICLGDSVTLVATGAVGTVHWYTGGCDSTLIGTGDSITLSPGQSAIYYAQNVNGGVPSDSCTSFLVVVSKPLAVASATPATCTGDSNGVVTATASGGINPYSYAWSTGGTLPQDTGLFAGTYYLTVTDSLGCTAFDSATVIEQFTLPIVTLGPDTTVCDPIELGPGPLFAGYAWSDASTDSTLLITGPGTYWVVATDVNTCSNSDTVTVTFFPDMSASAVTTPASCGIADGTATITLTAGPGGYHYLWSNGDTTTMADTLFAGPHSVTVTDTNGCTHDTTVAVLNGGAHTLNMSAVNVTCAGGNDGSASVTINGGTAPFTYAWNDPGMQTAATATGLSAGTYTVTVTDINLCLAFDSITVGTSFPLPLVNIGPDTLLCQGDSTVLNAGHVSSTFVWSDGFATATRTVDTSGTFSVLVTDTNTCVNGDTVTISVVPNPVVNLIEDTAFCQGESLLLDAGAGPFTYAWSDNSNGSTLLVSDSGSYAVTITDTNTCTGIDSMEVGLFPLPVVSIFGDSLLCKGESGVLHAGGGFANYLWNDGSITDSLLIDSANTYSVTVTDFNQCPGSDSLVASVFPLPVVDIGPPLDSVEAGFTLTLDADPLLPGATYQWQDGTAGPQYVVDVPGTYWVVVTDSNGCQSSDTIEITQATSLAEQAKLPVAVTFFPNPARGNLNYRFSRDVGQPIELEIRSLQGALVRRELLTDSSGVLSLQDLSPGVYLALVVLDGQLRPTRIVVQ